MSPFLWEGTTEKTLKCIYENTTPFSHVIQAQILLSSCNPQGQCCLEFKGQSENFKCFLAEGSSQQTGKTLFTSGDNTNSSRTSLEAHIVKNPSAVQETRGWSLGWEDPLEKGMATHPRILAWRIPWTEEPVQPMGSQRAAMTHTWLFFNNSPSGRAHGCKGRKCLNEKYLKWFKQWFSRQASHSNTSPLQTFVSLSTQEGSAMQRPPPLLPGLASAVVPSWPGPNWPELLLRKPTALPLPARGLLAQNPPELQLSRWGVCNSGGAKYPLVLYRKKEHF